MKYFYCMAWAGFFTLGCSEYAANDIDAPPSKPEVAIVPAYPIEGEDLNCEIRTASEDPEGDLVTYTYTWKMDDEVVDDMTTSFVSSDNIQAGQVWLCEVTPFANRLRGEKGTSAVHVESVNQAPWAPEVIINPFQPGKNDDLLCEVQTDALDLDGDYISYLFAWLKNGLPTGESTAVITADKTSPGDQWTCRVTPHDGQVEGPSGEATVTVCSPGELPECPGTSCLDILEDGYSTGDGLYWLDPTGTGAYPVFCDMTTDGGGWTLAMKFDDESSVFEYDAIYWTSKDVYNDGDNWINTDSVGTNAKFRAYNEVSGETMRLQFTQPDRSIHYRDLADRTLLELFSLSDEIILGGTESVSTCQSGLLTSMPDYDSSLMRFGSARQIFGINAWDSGAGTAYSKLRFGFGSNDELVSAWGGNIGIGMARDWHGVHTGRSVAWNVATDCYNNCSCYGNGDTHYDTSANLWVR